MRALLNVDIARHLGIVLLKPGTCERRSCCTGDTIRET